MPEELDWYVGLSGDNWLTEIIKGWWQGEGGQSAPDRCFVAEQEGKPVGRVFFYNLESSPLDQIMFGLHLNWETDWLTVGTDLLKQALAQMKTKGANSVEYPIYDIYQKPPELQRRVVEAAGFRLTQDKLRFVWKDQGSPVEVPGRLTFRALTETGEAEYVTAVERVTAGTLDREQLREVAESGPTGGCLPFYLTAGCAGSWSRSGWMTRKAASTTSASCLNFAATASGLTCCSRARPCCRLPGGRR